MKQFAAILILLISLGSCQNKPQTEINYFTDDIDHFWEAYDKITSTSDSLQQLQFLNDLYLSKGSIGLENMIRARNYTPQDYLQAINSYPKFWESIRKNTTKSKDLGKEIAKGIAKLKVIYPELKPAKIYFTMGALRSNGTTMDSLVLIGSELAMADKNTVSSEFPEPYASGRRKYFDSNPINNLVLLNVHEYVHTQQNEMVHHLLTQCLYEGIAEFVSTKAMNKPSASPAIQYGKDNEARVAKKFEEHLFTRNKTYEWLWSSADNEFGIRDLGYYIGYEISERYYNQATDKSKAIKDLIELDYTDQEQVDNLVDRTQFLSAPLAQLRSHFNQQRPSVVAIAPFKNQEQNVPAGKTTISVTFSAPMNPNYRSFEFGPLGKDHVLRMKNFIGFSEDFKTMQFEADLAPNQHYQLVIGSEFLNMNGYPLEPYLIDIHTGSSTSVANPS